MSVTKYLFDSLSNAMPLCPHLGGAYSVNSYDILQGRINSSRFSSLSEDMRISSDTEVVIVAKSVNTSVGGGIYSSSSTSALRGLYFIPAMLGTDGRLSLIQSKLPYFEEEFLGGEYCFGDRAAAHGYLANNTRLIAAVYANGSWEAYIKLAVAYFEEVCRVSYNECYLFNRADETRFILDRNCYILPAGRVTHIKPMLRLYARIFKAGNPNKLYGDFCEGNGENVSFITLTPQEKQDFIREIAVSWIVNNALKRAPSMPIVVGTDMSPSLRLAEGGNDLFGYWTDIRSSVQSLPAIDTTGIPTDSVFSACARRYGVTFSSAVGCVERIHRELTSLSLLNDRVLTEIKKNPGLMSFPCSDGKRQTFAASQTLLKCEELERTLRERRVEWEIFLQKLPARIKLFGGLKSVREEREELFAEFMGDKDSFLRPDMTPQQILSEFTVMAEKNAALMKDMKAKKALLDIIGEYSEFGIDFFRADPDGTDPDFICTVPDMTALIKKRVMPTMFWLAVHYYECVWASDPVGNPYTLAPVIFAPCVKIADQFDTFDSIPLLIIDHADSISPEYAGGLFALAKSAILICDGDGSLPVHTVPRGTDPVLAIRGGAIEYADEFEKIKKSGLSVSSCSLADCFRVSDPT